MKTLIFFLTTITTLAQCLTNELEINATSRYEEIHSIQAPNHSDAYNQPVAHTLTILYKSTRTNRNSFAYINVAGITNIALKPSSNLAIATYSIAPIYYLDYLKLNFHIFNTREYIKEIVWVPIIKHPLIITSLKQQVKIAWSPIIYPKLTPYYSHTLNTNWNILEYPIYKTNNGFNYMLVPKTSNTFFTLKEGNPVF